MRARLLDILYPVIAVALLFAVWAAAAAVIGEQLVLPTPAQTASALLKLIRRAAFWRAAGATFVRALAAYAVCLVVSLALAVAARLRPVRRILSPIMTIVRSVPTMAVIFLLLLQAGPKSSPVYVALTVLLPTMYAAFLTALDGIDSRLVEMSSVFRVPRARRLTQLYVPSLVPALVSSATYLSLALKLVVAAETIAMTAQSLGMLLQAANTAFETARMLAVAVAAVLIGFVIEGVAGLLKKPLKRRGYVFDER